MSTTRTRRLLGPALIAPFILAAMIAAPALASPAPAAAAPPASPAVPASEAPGSCTDDHGVTVVVDFTDLGGEIVAGCADLDPSNGRAALEAAGFTIAESQPGLICAIDDRPDPCPETFEGSFWSYWHATPDGDWTSYLVGADSSDPVPGELEGWRYNDGSAGPGLTPAEVANSLPSAPAVPATDDVEPATTAPTMDAAPWFWGAGIGALVILAAILLLLRSRRRGATEDAGRGEKTHDDAR